ncbi:MAG TPA: transglutaminase family protein [Chitinophagaceae bacterium]|jgi:transglutaminase-like putative cysteine protease|nr:transglutaminase family protein [Chitinophagaceae bacterium]
MFTYRIKHITRYTYPASVIDSANQVMLFPIDDPQQEVKKHELIITHQPSVEVFIDYFGNKTGIFSVIKPHHELTIQSNIEVILREAVLPANEQPAVAQWENLQLIREEFPYMDFMLIEHFEQEEAIQQIVASLKEGAITPLAVAQKMSAFVYDTFEYKKGITNVETKVDEIWALKAGVCQDFAHILLVMLRIAGVPARYVSGYICPKNHELRGEGATHAWVEAYIPFHGWVGLDPTNNCIASDRHVRLAIGRSFTDCTPVKGTYKGSSEHTLEVSVTIENGTPKKEDDSLKPVFTYQVHNPGVTNNSYRKFMEMQQQQ